MRPAAASVPHCSIIRSNRDPLALRRPTTSDVYVAAVPCLTALRTTLRQGRPVVLAWRAGRLYIPQERYAATKILIAKLSCTGWCAVARGGGAVSAQKREVSVKESPPVKRYTAVTSLQQPYAYPRATTSTRALEAAAGPCRAVQLTADGTLSLSDL